MKKSVFFITIVIFLALVAGCGSPKPVATDEFQKVVPEAPTGKIVRVGFFDDGKFMSGAADGEIKQGYGYEYLQMIAGHTGWKYKYVYGSWSQLYEKFLNGEIDIMPDVSYTDERAAKMAYPDEPMGHEIYYIACRSDNREINWNDLSSFNGKKIGVEKNSIQVKLLEEWIASNGLHPIVVPLSGGSKSKLEALHAGVIDALVMTHFKGKLDGISNVAVLGQSDYYLAVDKDRYDLLTDINIAQGKIADAHPVFLTKLEYKHFPDAMVDQRLNDDEEEWLAKKHSVRVGYLVGNLPFSGMNPDTNEPTGLMPIVIDSICDNLRIDKDIINYVPFDNGERMNEAFAHGDLDAVFGIYKNLSWAEKNNISQTDDITDVDISMIIRYGVDRNNISKIAVALDRPHPVYMNLLGLGDCELIFYKSVDDALEAVRQGDADCTFINEYTARKYLRTSDLYRGLEEIEGICSTGICMSIRRDEPHLISILRRGIMTLNDREVDNAVVNNAYLYLKPTPKEIFKEYWWLSIVAGIILLLILIILFIVNRSRRRIAKVNALLRSQKDMLQNANDRLLVANKNQAYANEELIVKNEEINELFDRQQEYFGIIEQNHEALKSANWLVHFDPIGNIEGITWSDGLRHILGYADTDEFPNTLETVAKIIHPDDLPVGAQFIDDLRNDRKQITNIIDMELRLKKRDGGYTWFRVYARISWRNDGTPLTLYGVCQDIEEYKKLIDQAEEASLKAQQASEAKSVFLSNMSHDMRTPMNGIMGYTTLALENIDKQSTVKEYLGKIKMVSKHLLSLINDVLDMSRIESGRIEFELQPTNIIALADELKSILQSDININNLTFNLDTSEVYNDTVLCDRLRLKQILLNLLGNAVKFTKDGAISLKLVEIAEDKKISKHSKYEFYVEDEGIGIDEEFIPKIFTPFERAQNSTVSGIQGTGLGMSITKRLVDMMGGDIQVTSELGKGTRFVVSLEFDTCEHQDLNAKDEKKEKYDFHGKRVLLVDDNLINQEIAKCLLENVNLRVDVAGNGAEAVEMVKGKKPKYDAVLMDIQMPIMDGYEATKAIRELADEYTKTVPIIAMTANVFAEDKVKALSTGMNGHVAKPIDLHELYSTLKNMMK